MNPDNKHGVNGSKYEETLRAFNHCDRAKIKKPRLCHVCYKTLTGALKKQQHVVPLSVEPTKGKGLYALREFQRGDEIAQYGGLIMTKEAAAKLPPEQRTHFRKLMEGLVIHGQLCFQEDAANPGLAAFANYSADPAERNAKLRRLNKVPERVILEATVSIAPGTEILTDYGRDYDYSFLDGPAVVGRPVGRPRKRKQPAAMTAAVRPLLSGKRKRSDTQ